MRRKGRSARRPRGSAIRFPGRWRRDATHPRLIGNFWLMPQMKGWQIFLNISLSLASKTEDWVDWVKISHGSAPPAIEISIYLFNLILFHFHP